MGHIAHLRKQFYSINTYHYIITLIRRRKNPLSSFWDLHGFLFDQTSIPFTQGCFVQSFVEIVPVVQEKILKFCLCIFVTSLSSLLGKRHGPSFEQLKCLHPKMHCSKFGWNWPSGPGKEDFCLCILAIP